MKTLLYLPSAILAITLICSCTNGAPESAQVAPLKEEHQCPSGTYWSTLTKDCISESRFETLLYPDGTTVTPSAYIGVVFSGNQDQAELFLGGNKSVILERNEQTLAYESLNQNHRLVKTKKGWMYAEVSGEHVARSVSIYASR